MFPRQVDKVLVLEKLVCRRYFLINAEGMKLHWNVLLHRHVTSLMSLFKQISGHLFHREALIMRPCKFGHWTRNKENK